MATTKTEQGTFFDSRKALHQQYTQKLSTFQTLIAQLAPEDHADLTTNTKSSEGYQFNSASNKWEKKQERKNREFAAANELFALFTKQAQLEDDETQLDGFNQSLSGEVNSILIKNDLRAQNPTLETTNQMLLQALRQLSKDLKISDQKITVKQAKVAIEVMDIVTEALNAHLGNNKTQDSKSSLSHDQFIEKLSKLGKSLENNEYDNILLAISALGVGLLTFAVVLTGIVILKAVLAPTIGMALITNTSQVLSFLGTAGISGFVAGLLVMAIGYTDSESLDINPTVAKAIIDVSKAWDLEPAPTSMSFTG